MVFLGITQKISDLQSSYNTARDWKRNTGAGILKSDGVNGVKTVETKSTSYADTGTFLIQLWDQEGQANDSTSGSTVNNQSNLPSSGRDATCSDDEAGQETITQTPTPAATASTTQVTTQKKKKKKKKSTTPLSKRNGKGRKKTNPEDFYMKSVITKRQAEMTKAQAAATQAKVSYMKELRELGLEYQEIKQLVDEEFPTIPDMLADSEEDESDSDEDSL
ncbi:uncharacterized protein PGTG_15078 [Puccinia graminis f. sp. tritici CRL 75-36-700-3]|uniref:No apical meristem-associated C-terminal domain-containing protein n=1 Tax=Puccinia graminis f. sp. tritici (strain CRL 75-36-700-3 / race SCCL) TaxID=418459 RepID=E3KY36_PUCGT|nr:uncharacterized protein PGTG_15078 [Puccinia graminis f. sp. tritici CRL 75-36-700-3]EFP89237.2 hypothetical protein PGTG_15078 [Puccinia graminis f. sp. tritici CRL 75-36-700-3]